MSCSNVILSSRARNRASDEKERLPVTVTVRLDVGLETYGAPGSHGPGHGGRRLPVWIAESSFDSYDCIFTAALSVQSLRVGTHCQPASECTAGASAATVTAAS